MNRIVTPVLRARQRGVVLVISLLLLLVLTVIGLAATRSTALEERMTSNQNDEAIAFQGAEAALRYGEGLLSSASQPDFSGNTLGAYTEGTMDTTIVRWDNDTMWDTTKNYSEPYGYGIITSNQDLIVTGNGDGTTTASQSPRYYIVYDNTASHNAAGSTLMTDQALVTKYVYYIYARGWGQTQNTSAHVTLEAIDSF